MYKRQFYDRAALIALPPEMRERYAGHLQAVLPTRSLGLLVTIDYPQAEMAGPPFAVPDEEVRGYYAGGWQMCIRDRPWVMGLCGCIRGKPMTQETVGFAALGIHPVSYTHLAVYKRQQLHGHGEAGADHREQRRQAGAAVGDAVVQFRRLQGVAGPCLLYTSRCV